MIPCYLSFIVKISQKLFLVLCLVFLTSCTLRSANNEKIVRLGFMPNVTHATALVGIEKNIFQEELGNKIKFKPMHFVVGNSIIDAIITGQIDVAYVGPGPFINALYRKIPIKLLANACNGGTVIVEARHGMPLQSGTRIAIPQYGNTQDLILRSYLDKNNLSNTVKIFSIPSQDTATAFFTMSIDAACVPEPWGTILIEKGVCKVLVDEKNVLNNGNYSVTILLANKKFADENPELINKILAAHYKSNAFIALNPDEAVGIVTKAISNISKKQIDLVVIAKSFKRCEFKNELDLKILKDFAAIGVKAGYYKEGFIAVKEDHRY